MRRAQLRIDLAAAGIALLLSAGLAGCSVSRGPLAPASRALGSDLDDLDPASLAVAAQRTATALERQPSVATFPIGGWRYSAADLAASARRVAGIAHDAKNAEQLTRTLAKECRTYRVPELARVTSYYEPVLTARRRPDGRFRYPVYAPPSASQLERLRAKLGRMPTRADIDRARVLRGLGLELAWVDDPVARFFLHVQGSGRLVLDDGSEFHVGFAASNGLPYRSVGSVMIADGILSAGHASAPAMRAWLAAHPDRRDALLERNPRYVFFRESAGDGPLGSLGAPLVAGRSIAVDDRFVPRGVLAWLRTTWPVVDNDGRVVERRPLTRFVFAQDTGAAIQGPARVDLYAGSGEKAGAEAGVMNETGELDLLLCGQPPASYGSVSSTSK